MKLFCIVVLLLLFLAISHNRNSNWKMNAHFISLLCMFGLVRFVLNTCQSSNGMNFIEHDSKALQMTPFKTSIISYYLTCLVECEANSRCNSLNIRKKGSNLQCELMAGDSRKFTLIPETDVTYFELAMQFTVRKFYK